MSESVLRARLVEAARVLYRQGQELEQVAASLTADVGLVPVTPPATWVVALPFYWTTDRERREVTRRIFRHYRNISDALGVRVTGVGSEGAASRGLWCEFFDEVDYREFPQNFQATNAGGEGLRAKFDETIRATRHLDPDRVFIGGSDDLIPIDWFEKAYASDADMVGVTGGAIGVLFQRGVPIRTAVWDGRYTHAGAEDVQFCGGGLMLGRGLLDSWGWAPFDAAGDEIRLERRARAEGRSMEGFSGPYYACKTAKALNQFAVMGRHGARPGGAAEMATFKARWSLLV